MDQANNKKIITALAVLVLIAVMVIGVKALASKSDSKADAGNAAATTNSQANTTHDSAVPAQPDKASPYKDGSYQATGAYRSPGGDQKLQVSLTVAGGKVTDSSVESGASDGTSADYQQKFISGYKALITGKSLDSLKLSKVSGSSLTSQGFNDAVEQIKNQAKQS